MLDISATRAVNVSFDQLQTLQLICELGSFSQTAEHLYISQPAVSQRIRHLERTFGIRIFDKATKRRGLTLTPEGIKLLELANETTSSLRYFQESLRIQRDGASPDTVVIICSTSLARYVLPTVLANFRQHCPDVHVVLLQHHADRIDDMLRHDKAHIGIRAGPPVNDEQLESSLLFTDHLVLVCPPVLPKPSEAGDIHDFVALHPRTHLRRFLTDWATASSLQINITFESNDLEGIKQAVLQGYGSALTCVSTVRAELQERRLITLDAPGLPHPWPYHLIRNRQRPRSEAVDAFLTLAPKSNNVQSLGALWAPTIRD
jgi:LysR family transcriptional regulator, low CO2-responsive transcriptional regulator